MTNHVRPAAGNTYDLGESTYYWRNVYADSFYYKTTSQSYDKYDDLGLISGTTTKIDPSTNKELIDLSNLPDDFFPVIEGQVNREFIDQKRLVSLILGALKQADRVMSVDIMENFNAVLEDHQARIAALEKGGKA